MKYYLLGVAVSMLLLSAGCGNTEEPAKTAAASSTTVASSSQVVHEISKESETIYHQAAQAYGKGNHTEALKLANEALQKDEKNYKALSLKGILLAFDVSPEDRIASVQRALEVNPHYTQAFFDMAMAQKLGKHYDESIFYFEKVLQVDPKNTWSYYGIATNYADKHDKEKALSYLKQAMALDPQNVRPEAKTQDHFAWMRNDEDFLQTIK